MRRAVITGLGAVTALGRGVDRLWRGVLDGACATGPIRGCDASGFPTAVAAEAGVGDRVALAMVALDEALGQAGLSDGDVREMGGRAGVCVGAEAGRATLARLRALAGGAVADGRVDPARLRLEEVSGAGLAARLPTAVGEAVRRRTGARGPGATHALACASSAAALAEALDLVRDGDCDLALAVGAAADVDQLMLAGFSSLQALSPSGRCRPFDAARDGFLLGEGAAALVVEEEGAARARRARAIVEIAGAGSSLDAHRMTDPRPDGSGARLAMARALDDAGATGEDVVLVAAHGTGTPQNDLAEGLAIDALLGERPPAVFSAKGAVGHLIAAAGALNAVLLARALVEGVAPPTAGLETLDAACRVDASRAARPLPRDGGLGLANALAFGGANVALLLRRWP